MSGSENFPLLVIGRFAKPRYFKNARTIPVQYEANKKAWMVCVLFSSWLKKLDKNFKQDMQKTAMVVDNSPAHPNIQSKLESITFIFLPPNTNQKGLSVIGGMDYWNGLLEWTLTFFFFFPRANSIH